MKGDRVFYVVVSGLIAGGLGLLFFGDDAAQPAASSPSPTVVETEASSPVDTRSPTSETDPQASIATDDARTVTDSALRIIYGYPGTDNLESAASRLEPLVSDEVANQFIDLWTGAQVDTFSSSVTEVVFDDQVTTDDSVELRVDLTQLTTYAQTPTRVTPLAVVVRCERQPDNTWLIADIDEIDASHD